MNNDQLAGARAALSQYPTLKVTLGQTADGDTLTPYLASDVFTRGETVTVTSGMTREQVRAAFSAACARLLAS